MFELVSALAAHSVEIVVRTSMLGPRMSTSIAVAQRCPLAGDLSATGLSLEPSLHPKRMAPRGRTNILKCCDWRGRTPALVRSPELPRPADSL